MAARPRDSDCYWDMLGQRGQFQHCHPSFDNMFYFTVDSGAQASVYQGGCLAVDDLDCMKELAIGLVISCTSDISAPIWHGGNDVPRLYRFPILGEICDHHRSGLPILPLFTKFYQVFSNSILRGMNVLIYCRAGDHRAGTRIAASGMDGVRIDFICCSEVGE